MQSQHRTLKVAFAPDWRAGGPYQTHLAEALEGEGVNVHFLSTYRRGLPLTRGLARKEFNILHLHWPEAYFENGARWSNILRTLRYPFDLKLAIRKLKLVLTAHNLLPHDQGNRMPGASAAISFTMKSASAVFAHSEAARAELLRTFDIEPSKCHVIPFGDLSLQLGKPHSKEFARRKLSLPVHGKICLMFGTISPYKGSDQIVDYWRKSKIPYRLVVVGKLISNEFRQRLIKMRGSSENIDIYAFDNWLSHTDLNIWLSAADAVIFNYMSILSSGAAALSRSFGTPIVLPRRLSTIDLAEPDNSVFRFESLESDFIEKLEAALCCKSNFASAFQWREMCSWSKVAECTVSVYKDVSS